MSKNLAIDVRDLCLEAGSHVLVDQMSLSVVTGERVCLRGASGRGKSLLLRCLMGLRTPRSGEIFISGERLTSGSAWHLRKMIAWAPQSPDWGQLSVREILHRPFEYGANRHQNSVLTSVPDRLEELGLSPAILEKRSDLLSGGEKQRVGLLAAVLLKRPILLLDEVTSALDEENRARARDWLNRTLQSETVVAVSHDAEAETWCSRILDWESCHG